MDILNSFRKACFTGYRPDKFDFELNKRNKRYKLLLSRLEETVTSLIKNGCSVFYCGMAVGFDIIAAECVLKFKRKYKNLRLVCAIPYLGHEVSIKGEWLSRYNAVLNKADEIVYISSEYQPSCFQMRNRYMVDASECVITWFDGKSGGTQNTIKYAQKQGVYIINLNTDYELPLNNLQQNISIF